MYFPSLVCFSHFFFWGLITFVFSREIMQPGNIYFSLFINHLALFLFIVPLSFIRLNRIKIAGGTYHYSRLFIYAWTLILGVILITLGALTFVARDSLSIYFIYIIVANFGLLMTHINRILLNVVSLLIISVTIFFHLYETPAMLIASLMEAFGLTLLSFVVSTQNFNFFVLETNY